MCHVSFLQAVCSFSDLEWQPPLRGHPWSFDQMALLSRFRFVSCALIEGRLTLRCQSALLLQHFTFFLAAWTCSSSRLSGCVKRIVTLRHMFVSFFSGGITPARYPCPPRPDTTFLPLPNPPPQHTVKSLTYFSIPLSHSYFSSPPPKILCALFVLAARRPDFSNSLLPRLSPFKGLPVTSYKIISLRMFRPGPRIPLVVPKDDCVLDASLSPQGRPVDFFFLSTEPNIFRELKILWPHVTVEGWATPSQAPLLSLKLFLLTPSRIESIAFVAPFLSTRLQACFLSKLNVPTTSWRAFWCTHSPYELHAIVSPSHIPQPPKLFSRQSDLHQSVCPHPSAQSHVPGRGSLPPP